MLLFAIAQVFAVFAATCFFLANLQLDIMHLCCICVTILLSNLCTVSIISQYICAMSFVSTRFHNINCILRQLLFDESLDDFTVFVHRNGIRKNKSKCNKPAKMCGKMYPAEFELSHISSHRNEIILGHNSNGISAGEKSKVDSESLFEFGWENAYRLLTTT